MNENQQSQISQTGTLDSDSSTSSVTVRASYLSKNRSGSVNPLWGKPDTIVVGPYYGFFAEYESSSEAEALYRSTAKSSKSFRRFSGLQPGFNAFPVLPSFPTNLHKEAFAEAFNAWRNEADPQIVFAEYISEIISLKSIWLGTLGVVTSFIRKIMTAKKGDLPGLWIEFNFAVKPVASDIEVILKRLNPSNRITRLHRRIGTDQIYSATGKQVGVPGTTNPANINWHGKVEFSTQCTIVGFNTWVIDPGAALDTTSGMLHFLKLGSAGDVLDSAWNLVPFSWAIDYFLSIGTLIQSWFPPKELPAGTVVYSDRTKFSASCYISWNKVYGSYALSNNSPGSAKYTATRLTRSISGTVGEYSLRDDPELFEINAGIRQVSYLLAILFNHKK